MTGEWKTDRAGGHRLHSGKRMADIQPYDDQWWLTIHDMETPTMWAVVDRRFSTLEEAKAAAESAFRAGVATDGWKTDGFGGYVRQSDEWLAEIKPGRACRLTVYYRGHESLNFVIDRHFPSLKEAKAVADPYFRSNPNAGIKHDDDKQRWDLLPYDALEHVVKVLTLGAKKYAEWNWMYVERAEDRYFAAAQRHLVAWRGGEGVDPETGVSHIAHAICCLLFLLSLRPNHGGKPQTAQK